MVKSPPRVSARREQPRSKRQGRRPRPLTFVLISWLVVAAVWFAVLIGGVVFWYSWDLPSMDKIDVIDKRPAIRLIADDGSVFATLGDLYGTALTAGQYPKVLVNAVLATEDRRFYDHGGFDLIGIFRALFTDIMRGHLVQGGSTISQQTAKTVFLTPARSIRRKVQEAILTIELEKRFTKDQILALYLNRVYLGAGTYGMVAASRRYFGHGARTLTLSEAAMLAGLMKAPSRYSPLADYHAAVKRAAVVLDNMVAAGVVTAAEAAKAKAAPAPLAARPVGNNARYFVDWVVNQIADYAGQSAGDITVYTTLDLKAQRAAERALVGVLDKEGAKRKASQGALIALGSDGAVLAMLGGRNYGRSQFNRASRALRQPGSAFKLFPYLAALEAGMTPDSVVEDAPLDIDGYRPTNSERGFAGPVTLATALAKSINTVAVRLLLKVGVGKVVDMAHRLGISSDIPANASIALGSAEVTPLELTAAYATVANGGKNVWPYGITKVVATDGTLLYERSGGGAGHMISPKVAGEMNTLLAGVVTRGTGRAAALGRPAGGKTGTSQDYRNAWFVGFSSGITAGVWVGNDNGSPMNKVTGGSLPARIWKGFMSAALKGKPATRLFTVSDAGGNSLLDRLFQRLGGVYGGKHRSIVE